MHILEIFNHLHDTDRSSIDFNHVVDSDLPQGHTHLTISNNRVLQCNVFVKLCMKNITTYSTWILPCHEMPSVRPFYFKVQIHLPVIKRCFACPGSVHRDLFTPPICVKHPSDIIVYTSSDNCSPTSNNSSRVTTASYSEWIKCHSSGYINSTPFGDIMVIVGDIYYHGVIELWQCTLLWTAKQRSHKASKTPNYTTKTILGRNKYDSLTLARHQLHWLPVLERIKFKLLTLVYKCLNDQAPLYVQKLL